MSEPTNTMKGNNQIILCLAEMKIAMQEYIDKRMGKYASNVHGIAYDSSDYTFTIQLTDKEV